MNKLLILLFFISLLPLHNLKAQEVSDSIPRNEQYGLRLGVDVMNQALSLFGTDVKGFDLVGDIRFMRNYYAAVELGFNERNKNEDLLSFSSKGSYIKLGVNYNAYKNWVGMRNEIFMGLRRDRDLAVVFPSSPPGRRPLPAGEVAGWFRKRGYRMAFSGEKGVKVIYRPLGKGGEGTAVIDNHHRF